MVGAAGRRRIRARRASPPGSGQKPHVSQRRGDPLGRPRPFMPTRLFMAGTNKSRGSASVMEGDAGRRRMRARQCLAPTRSGQKPHVSQRRGDPLGRPRPFMPTRSFMTGTNKSRGVPRRWLAQRGVAGLGRGMPRPHGPAKSPMCPNVGATHWVALGHSCQRACSWLGQTNREACLGVVGDAGRRRMRARRASPPRSRQKLHVSQRRGDPLGRPRSFMPTRLFMAGTNKSRGVPR